MKARLLDAAALLLFAMGVGESHANVIGPNDFGPQAQIETFDSLTAGSPQRLTPLVLNGVTYDISGGNITEHVDPLHNPNSGCISGACLATYSGFRSTWIITLDNPVNRVGGYLGGVNFVASNTDVLYFDANNQVLTDLGGQADFHPIPIPQTELGDRPAFFGFESDVDLIKYVQINADAGQGRATLDNFTSEIMTTPLPAALPLLATGLGVMGLLGWSRKRKGPSVASPCGSTGNIAEQVAVGSVRRPLRRSRA
jgi:hypothetical protein